MLDPIVVAPIAAAAAALSKQLATMLADLLGPAIKQAGELIADPIRAARTKTLVTKTLPRLERKLRQAGITTPAQTLNLKTVWPMLEAASMVDDDYDELHDMWAGLLASAVAGDSIHPGYVPILKQLTASEVRGLETLWKHLTWRQGQMAPPQFGEEIRDNDQVAQMKDNLARLGLVQPSYHDLRKEKRKYDPTGVFQTYESATGNEYSETVTIQSAQFIELSAYGRAFVAACRGSAPE